MITGPRTDLDELRERFLRDHFVVVPDFFSQALISSITREILSLPFEEYAHLEGGSEFSCRSNFIVKLNHIISDPEVVKRVANITSIPELKWASGRIYKFEPEVSFLDWHADTYDNRRVAFSVNISPEPYEGGELRIRKAKDTGEGQMVENLVPGNAVLFLISKDYQHSVRPVTGAKPKFAFTGWFRDSSIPHT